MADPFDPNDPIHRGLGSLGSLARTGNEFNPRMGQMRAYAMLEERNSALFSQMLEADRTAREFTDLAMRALNGGESVDPETDQFKRMHAMIGYTVNNDMMGGLLGRGNLFNVGLGSQMISRMSGATTLNSAQEMAVTSALFKGTADYFQSQQSGYADQTKAYGLNFTELGDIQTMIAASGGFTGMMQGSFNEDTKEFEVDENFEQRMNERISNMAKTMSALKNVFGGQPMQELIRRAEEVTGLQVGSTMDEQLINQRLMDIQSTARANGMTNMEAVMSLEADAISNFGRLGVDQRMAGSMLASSRSQIYGSYNMGMSAANELQDSGRYMNVQSVEHTMALTQADQAALMEENKLSLVAEYALENNLRGDPSKQHQLSELRERYARAAGSEKRDASADLYSFLHEEIGENPYDYLESRGGVSGMSASLSGAAQERLSRSNLTDLTSRQRDQIQNRMYSHTQGGDVGRDLVTQMTSIDRESLGKLSRELMDLGPDATSGEIGTAAYKFLRNNKEDVFFGEGSDMDSVVDSIMDFAGSGGDVGSFMQDINQTMNQDDMSNFMNEATADKLAQRKTEAQINSAKNMKGEWAKGVLDKGVRAFLGEERMVTGSEILDRSILAAYTDTEGNPTATRMKEKLMAREGFFSYYSGAMSEEEAEAMEDAVRSMGRGEDLNNFYNEFGIDPEGDDRAAKLADAMKDPSNQNRMQSFVGSLGMERSVMVDDGKAIFGHGTSDYIRDHAEDLFKGLETETIEDVAKKKFGVNEEFITLMGEAMTGKKGSAAEFTEYLTDASNFATDAEMEKSQGALDYVIRSKTEAFEEEKAKGEKADKDTLESLQSELRKLRGVQQKSEANDFVGRLSIVKGDELIMEVYNGYKGGTVEEL
jgi:hypothetical protein